MSDDLSASNFAADESASADPPQREARLADPIIRLISSADFPFNPDLDERSDCSESERRGVDFQTCESAPLQPCPFSATGECEMEYAIFANGKLSSVSFRYAPEDFRMQQFVAVATRMLGSSNLQTKGSPGAGIEMTMTTRSWTSPKLKVSVIEAAGVNFSGEAYNNVSVLFRNRSLPDPMEVIASSADR